MICLDTCCYHVDDIPGMLICAGASDEDIRSAFESREQVPYTFETRKKDNFTITEYSQNLNPLACLGYANRHTPSIQFSPLFYQTFGNCAANVFSKWLQV